MISARFTYDGGRVSHIGTPVFNVAGIDRTKFLEYTESMKATYATWSRRGGEWAQRSTGAEDVLRSPYLDEEFERAQVCVCARARARACVLPHHPARHRCRTMG